jgi:hypothetical protein
MTTPDNTEHPNEEVQELTDENLEEVSGGHQANMLWATPDATVAGLQPIAITEHNQP